MKRYVQNEGYREIGHGRPDLAPCLPFIVTARYGGCSRSMLVMAPNGEEAIERLKANIANLIADLKASLPPEDLLPRTVLVHDEAGMTLANALALENAQHEDKLIELEDRTDEIADTHRATLTDSITRNNDRIKTLRETKEQPYPSKFDRMCVRINELIAPGTVLSAHPLSNDRVYALAYFDDPRDYIGSES